MKMTINTPTISGISARLSVLSVTVIFFGLVFIINLAKPSAVASSAGSLALASATQCKPTRPDSLGPFYKPDAPQRISVGSGYRLDGVVRSAATCSPIAGARIELWLAGPDGAYDDDYRATVYASDKGEYGFESHPPPAYHGRPPHIHIRVSAAGFKTLATQHYPSVGRPRGNFDLVLMPLK
jgi:protocatechuate 3,4-dioxygenase beta subunit